MSLLFSIHFSIHFVIHLMNKSEFSWKTQHFLGDPKLLNGSVHLLIEQCF